MLRPAATVIALVAITAVATAPAGGELRVPTVVAQLSWTDSEDVDDEIDFFDGRLGSRDDRCKKNRQLRLYREQAGPDPLIKRGRSLTFNPGDFILEAEDPGSGRYYLKVRPKEVGAITCGPAVSPTLSITDLE